MSATAPLAEIFFSFQGEGLYVGVSQIFVRLRGCKLTCRYCDTPIARLWEGSAQIEWPPGSNQFEPLANPLSAEETYVYIHKIAQRARIHSVSFTGGEPLLHPHFLVELMAKLRDRGFRTYLDTACCYPEAMALVAPYVDIVAADYKLPATMQQPLSFQDFAHSWKAIQGERFIKMVVTEDVQPRELAHHSQLLADLDPQAKIILQPATARGEVKPPGGKQLIVLAEIVARYFPDVRVIPQCHPILGVR